MVRHHWRGRWRSVRMRHGKPFVTDAGITMMLLLSAANWDTHEMVQKPWLTHCWQPSFKARLCVNLSSYNLEGMSLDCLFWAVYLSHARSSKMQHKKPAKRRPRIYSNTSFITISWGKKVKATQVQCTQLHDLCKLCIQYIITVFANCTEWLHHLYFASVHAWMSNYICENCTPYSLH